MFAAVLCAKLASTKYCTNLGPRVFVPTVFFTTGLYCLLVPQCSSVYTIYLLQLLPGLSTGFLYSYLTSEAMKGVPVEKKSTAMGFFQAVYALGMTFIPMICGSITATSSISTSYYFLMALCFLSSILAFFYYRKYA